MRPHPSHTGRISQAVIITVVLAAMAHLLLATASFATTHQVAYINPISFLGLGPLLPGYLNSPKATVLAWCILVSICSVIFIAREWLRAAINRSSASSASEGPG